jgi:outer membrane protein assembly factor BamA
MLLQQALQTHLSRHGFVFAEIRTALNPDRTGAPAVDVVLTAARGAAYKMSDPVLRDTRTAPTVARRLALWQDGENYDPARVERGLARLGRLGYFESVGQEGLYRDATRHVLYPVLRLPDARANTIGGLLGYDTEAAAGAKLTGFLDVRLLNMRGTARDFEFAFDGRTGREREARAAYTEPWVLGTPFGARFEGRLLQQDTIFQEWQNGLFIFRDLDFNSRIEVEFGAQANRDYSADTRSSALLSGVRLLYDSRDRAPFTRQGTRGHAGLTGLRRTLDSEAAAAGVDSSYLVARVQAAAEHWVPLTGRLGLKGGFAAATNVPLSRINSGELYDVGGARSLRGYRERQFQTNAYVLTDAELQWAVGRRGRVFGFVSPGLVNRLGGRYDFNRVFGYGTGLELSQGDWSVALTYALNPDRPWGDGYLHAAVENRF